MARYRSWSVSRTVPSKLAHSSSIALIFSSTPSVPMAAIAVAIVVGNFVMPALTTAGSTLIASGETTDVGVDDALPSSSEHAENATSASIAAVTPVRRRLANGGLRRIDAFRRSDSRRSPPLIQYVRYTEHYRPRRQFSSCVRESTVQTVTSIQGSAAVTCHARDGGVEAGMARRFCAGNWVQARTVGCLVVAGLGLLACSDSKSATTTTQDVLLTQPEILGANLATVSSANDLPVQPALNVLHELFTVNLIHTESQESAQLGLQSCPLGKPADLTATPPAPVPGLDGTARASLLRSRGAVLDINCSFSTADGTQAQLQTSYIPPAYLQTYVKFLQTQEFDQNAGRFIDGVVYTHCGATDTGAAPGSTTIAPSTSAAAGSSDCSAIWYFNQMAIGLRFSGPGATADNVMTWMMTEVEPIIKTLAATDAKTFQGPGAASAGTGASATTAG